MAMPSSTSSSESPIPADRDPGFDPARLHHAPLSPGLRLTASDRPGVAQPVPQRDIPARPWPAIASAALLGVILLSTLWEWQMRRIGLVPGDLGDDPSAWVEQRRHADAGPGVVAIIGDSRILFDTDLDRFQRLTGVRPLQLAIAGTNGLPFLENLAADTAFSGLAIVGITELSYYQPGAGRGSGALARWAWESPKQHASLLLGRMLKRRLAMLDDSYRFSNIVAREDPDWRPGARGPYDDVWKMMVTVDGRQSWLWPKLQHDAALRAHARMIWLTLFRFAKPTPALIAAAQERTRAAVAKIRARGGDVVFVRPPSAAPLRPLEDSKLPRALGWDALLRAADVRGVHADDLPAARGLVLPDMSHLTHACAHVFTDVYVRALAEMTPRLRIMANAPPALPPAACTGPNMQAAP